MNRDHEVNGYIEQFPPEFAAILQRLRELIAKVAPDCNEAIKWSRPCFSKGTRPICYIGGFRKHVSLAFTDGRLLRDPEGLLEGTGKMRTMKYRSLNDLDEDRVRHWILEAFYT